MPSVCGQPPRGDVQPTGAPDALPLTEPEDTFSSRCASLLPSYLFNTFVKKNTDKISLLKDTEQCLLEKLLILLNNVRLETIKTFSYLDLVKLNSEQ